jgi:predicted nucleotidyltransferase
MFKLLNILNPFFIDPNNEFNVREISRIIKISPATASKYLKDMSNKDILKHKIFKNLDLYKANLENDMFTDLKKFYTVRKIKDLGLLGELNDFYYKPNIVLFGSAAFGLDDKSSDLDFLINSENIRLLDVKPYEKKLNRKIELFVYDSISKIKNEDLLQSMLQGIIIQGEIKWIKTNAKKKVLSKKQREMTR